PVAKARAEAVAQRGGDAFNDYALPRAVMRFRQGFGRLIRTKSDRGAVIIADIRVHQRGYGRRFLDALPACTRLQTDARSLAEAVRRWLPPAAPPGDGAARARRDADPARRIRDRISGIRFRERCCRLRKGPAFVAIHVPARRVGSAALAAVLLAALAAGLGLLPDV